MARLDPIITDHYALYHGDCIEILQSVPDASVDFSIYSPPFIMLYQYSSDPADLSNSLNAEEFFAHYEFVVRAIARVTRPGRLTAVHCMDIPTGNTGLDAFYDFPGDIIRLHQRLGFEPVKRHHVWKEPLTVRNRTMTKSLSHKMVTEDATRTSLAYADQLLIFRRAGHNAVPVTHPTGLLSYAGARAIPHELQQYRGWDGNQIENRFSHWIWRQYASAFWDDVRLDHVLPYRQAREDMDEKHCHPLQLDVITRCIQLYTNKGETVLTPFMGVGSEVYEATRAQRRALGIELKLTYFQQAVRNVQEASRHTIDEFGQEEIAFAQGGCI